MTFEPLEKQYWEHPYRAYRQLRDSDRLHWAPGAQVFCASRYDEAEFIFKHPDIFSSGVAFDLLVNDRWKSVGLKDVVEMVRFFMRSHLNPLSFRNAPETLLSSDPPRHDTLRRTVNRGFTPRHIAAWKPRVRELCEQYLANFEDAQHVEIIAEFSNPLPMTIIAEMLGIETDRLGDFRRWSNNIISGLTGANRADSPRALLRDVGEWLGYLRVIVERRRKNPGDDLISTLVDPKHQETLDTESVLTFASILLIAGNETTTNAIGSTIQLLLEHSQVLSEVQADATLIPALIEESIRLESPFQFMPRLATCDTELRGTLIPKNSTVLVMIGAANRDERHFAHADRLDLHRNEESHLAFGRGIHFCLGAALARLEAQVALEVIIPQLHRWEIAEAGTSLGDSYFTRGPSHLDLVPAGTGSFVVGAKSCSQPSSQPSKKSQLQTHDRPSQA
ncbi:MAG: cytochrome P450 [Hyphomicrobiaceae bacterium]|jgi:cytochrome P450